jgi:2-iminoacetate synthase
LTLYQETYDESLYATYHQRGPKANFHWRLEGHDRAAEAGMPRLGLGILLGLAEPSRDLLAMMRHGAYLLKRFPGRKLAFSLPRIHQAPAGFEIPFPISDDMLIRCYCALRIAFPSAELVLSTRESACLRNRLAKVCITQMSAGSSTTPGGYADDSAEKPGEQFPVSDDRTVQEIVHWAEDAGFEISWSPECGL